MPKHQSRGKVDVAPEQHCPVNNKACFPKEQDAINRARILDRTRPVLDGEGKQRPRRVYLHTLEEGGCGKWEYTTWATPERSLGETRPTFNRRIPRLSNRRPPSVRN